MFLKRHAFTVSQLISSPGQIISFNYKKSEQEKLSKFYKLIAVHNVKYNKGGKNKNLHITLNHGNGK